MIVTLTDDLDQRTDQASKIALVASDRSDRGVIGGTWYMGHDRDTVVVAPGAGAIRTATKISPGGSGATGPPDVLAVVLDGPIRSMDAWTHRIVTTAQEASAGSTVVAFTGSGSAAADRGDAVRAMDVVGRVDRELPGHGSVISGVAPGGILIDQHALASLGITSEPVVRALDDASSDGSKLFDDVFQRFAVSLERYC